MAEVTGIINRSNTNTFDVATVSIDSNNSGCAGTISVFLAATDGTDVYSVIRTARFIGVRADGSGDNPFGVVLVDTTPTAGQVTGSGTTPIVPISKVEDDPNHTVTFRATPTIIDGSPTSYVYGYVVTELLDNTLTGH